jgi:hypothetical protein
MTAIFYDTEFLEDGRTIDLISIGMVAEDGREYYAVVNGPALITRAWDHEWLREHVIPSLPVKAADLPGGWDWDKDHADFPAVKDRPQIASEVAEFILSVPQPQLWAWYGSYDHVVLSQLWGRMIDHPEGVPMWTANLRQEVALLGYGEDAFEHNALADAREVRFRAQWLAQHWQHNVQRWPSMRLVRDVDDFTVGVDEDGEPFLRCPSGHRSGLWWDDPMTFGKLLTVAYQHVDEHKAAGT